MIALFGCATAIPFGEDPEISNHVDDWRDEIVYQALTDRFANGDVNNDLNVSETGELARHQGGDWQGLIDRVDYLDALGVTAVWISPVVTNVEEDAGVAGYHGYWAQDFTQPNPHFGDLATLRELVAVMHEHDIKVIVDIVVNHIGQLFYYDINQNGQPDVTTWYATDGSDELDIVTEWDPGFDDRGIQSFTSLGEAGPAPIEWVDMPELNRVPPVPTEFWNDDWYKQKGRVTDWDDDAQVEEGDFPGGLKDLETRNPNVRAALIQVYSDWIRQTNIDGYRIDTVKHVEHDFWEEFCPAIRSAAADLGKEKFLLFGEAFDGDDALIGSYTAPDMLDSVAYFSQKYAGLDQVFLQGAGTSALSTVWEARATNWGSTAQPGGAGVAPVDLPVNFLDNHDVPRFASQGDQIAVQLAAAVLYSEPGLPVLYYGTEQGFSGANDPSNRERLWDAGYAEDGTLFTWLAALAEVRGAREALRRGDFALRWASDRVGDEEDAGILAYERATDADRVLVVLNSSDHDSTPSHEGNPMSVGFAPGTELVAIFPPGVDEQLTVGADGSLAPTLPARSVRFYAEAP